MDEHARDVLAHLAADWDAQAAELERDPVLMHLAELRTRAGDLREHAGQLRDRLLRLRVPVRG
jgi:hypothetical protein